MTGSFRCWQTRNVLDLFVDGRLAPEQEERVAAHLAACSACRAEADTLRPLPMLKGAAPAAPAGLAESILRRYREEAEVPAAPAWRLSPAQAAGLAVVALLALAQALPGPASQGLRKPAAAEARK